MKTMIIKSSMTKRMMRHTMIKTTHSAQPLPEHLSQNYQDHYHAVSEYAG